MLRVSTATTKITAALNSTLGAAIRKKPCRCGPSMLGPIRSASSQGIQLPTMMPRLIPSMGISAIMVAPRNLPIRYCPRVIGVEKMICEVLYWKSRIAVPFTNAVTIKSPMKDIIP